MNADQNRARASSKPKSEMVPERCHRIPVNEMTDTIDENAPNGNVPLLV